MLCGSFTVAHLFKRIPHSRHVNGTPRDTRQKTVWGQIRCKLYRKIHYLTREFHVKFNLRSGSIFVSLWKFLHSGGQFAPKCSILVGRPLGHCFFRISWQIPSFQKFHFYDVMTLVLYSGTSFSVISRFVLFVLQQNVKGQWLTWKTEKNVNVERIIIILRLLVATSWFESLVIHYSD